VRIAVLTWSRRLLAGTEAYVATLIPALRAAGHTVGLVSELDQPADRDPIEMKGEREWCAAALGSDRLVSDLERWKPDALYCHGLLNPQFEARLLKIAPGAFFAHGYYGTCISGTKSYRAPVAHMCDRRFGWPCLLQYYPRRCGGLNPVTMVRHYNRQGARLKLLRLYSAILTHSRRMESEYLNHGIPRERVHRLPWCVEETEYPQSSTAQISLRRSDSRPHIAFIGRMERVKGGQVLLRSLPLIQKALGLDLRVTFAGDGTKREAWERAASKLSKRHPELHITFCGWLGHAQRDALLDECDLLAVPSIWPEPFGQVGIEAGRRGVPAAAFSVGGIPDWLEAGVNGFLAPADPPRPGGLAEAAVKCLRDRVTLERLRHGAFEVARRHTVSAHIARLEPILSALARSIPPSGPG